MPTALLDGVVYAFRDLFGSQNFVLFSAYLWGVILCQGRHTVTGIYLASQPERRYWSLVKFLSRGQWDETMVVQRLIGLILEYVSDWVYIYDHTHALKTGEKQFGLHFFRNHRYRKGNTNQSKFHWGHQFAGLGLLALDGPLARLFPVWVKLLSAEALGRSALAAFVSIIGVIPAGLIIFDRGFNNRKYFHHLLTQGHQLLCRARKNAAFYYLPTAQQQPARGRRRLYGRRVHVAHWDYTPVAVSGFDQPLAVAHRVVRSKMCPHPVRLVVVRKRPQRGRTYRYFLVYTTDLQLSVETIIRYYKLRWSFETHMRDSKEELGFDHYQVHCERAIDRSVLLSFVAASLTQLIAWPAFERAHRQTFPALDHGLKQMGIHWYQPQRWTLGLLLGYLRWQHHQPFSASIDTKQNQPKFGPPYELAAG
ncbi:MAG: transposase [Candidatus Handelsmanbacteria bacterium]|nr:transposase [Candidatus Handelsmanbacteria bacterium]